MMAMRFDSVFLNFDDEFSNIADIGSLYTIHNLSYQSAIVPKYISLYGMDNVKIG
jgi:glycogen synthase